MLNQDGWICADRKLWPVFAAVWTGRVRNELFNTKSSSIACIEKFVSVTKECYRTEGIGNSIRIFLSKPSDPIKHVNQLRADVE
jgi:hypothetical protein